MHAFRTRKAYKAIVLRLVNWSATTRHVRFRSLDELDARAEELVSCYLQMGVATGKSA